MFYPKLQKYFESTLTLNRIKPHISEMCFELRRTYNKNNYNVRYPYIVYVYSLCDVNKCLLIIIAHRLYIWIIAMLLYLPSAGFFSVCVCLNLLVPARAARKTAFTPRLAIQQTLYKLYIVQFLHGFVFGVCLSEFAISIGDVN